MLINFWYQQVFECRNSPSPTHTSNKRLFFFLVWLFSRFSCSSNLQLLSMNALSIPCGCILKPLLSCLFANSQYPLADTCWLCRWWVGGRLSLGVLLAVLGGFVRSVWPLRLEDPDWLTHSLVLQSTNTHRGRHTKTNETHVSLCRALYLLWSVGLITARGSQSRGQQAGRQEWGDLARARSQPQPPPLMDQSHRPPSLSLILGHTSV